MVQSFPRSRPVPRRLIGMAVGRVPPVSDRAMRAWPHLGVGVEVTCDRVLHSPGLHVYLLSSRVVLCRVSVFTFLLCQHVYFPVLNLPLRKSS